MADNAKGMELLEFVLVVTSKCLSGGKKAERLKFLGGYLLQLLKHMWQGLQASKWGPFLPLLMVPKYHIVTPNE